MLGGVRKIGILRKFFKIENSIYCFVQDLGKKYNFIEDIEENIPVISYLDKFFLICNICNNFTVISITQIITKCVLLI